MKIDINSSQKYKPSRKTSTNLLILLGIFAFVSFASPISAEKSTIKTKNLKPNGQYASFTPTGDIRRFAGETLIYDVSFLFFTNAATTTISFYEEDGKYYATLRAETKGFVGFMTSYRKHFYKATFEIIENGSRVRSTKFERKVIIGKHVESSINHLDYLSRQHWWFDYSNGDLKEQGSREIPKGVYFDDILAAFFNTRNGVYGQITKGYNYNIYTIPDKSMEKIEVSIKSEKEEEEYRRRESRAKSDAYLFKTVMPKDVFKTKTGELFVWMSKHLVPVETTVKGYLILGDLHARLKERVFKSSHLVSNSKSASLGKINHN